MKKHNLLGLGILIICMVCPYALAEGRKLLGVPIVTDTEFPLKIPNGFITAEKPGKEEVARYLPFLEKEFSIYSKTSINRAGLANFLLCRKLRVNGNPVPALAYWPNILVDVSRAGHSDTVIRRTLHHEFFHLLDYQMNPRRKDPAWEALNVVYFKYGQGGLKTRRAPSNVSKTMPGFLNWYSQASIAEDKAEVYAHMIVPDALSVNKISNDKILKAKTERIKTLLLQFSSEFGPMFWARISK